MKELQAKAKVTQTMTRDGLVVENQADGTVENVSSREAEQDYSTDAEGKAEKILERAEDIKDGHKNKKKAKKAAETAATAESEDGLHGSAARLELTEEERADPALQPYNKGPKAWEQDKAEREMVLTEFIPYLKQHCNLSAMEQTATTALREGQNISPEQAAYYNAVVAYVQDCRPLLNQGQYNLPEPPKLADFDQSLQDYKAQVQAEIAQEAADAGMTVEEYAAAGFEAPQQGSFSIYQLRNEDSTRDYRFEPYDRLQAAGRTVDKANYTEVYAAPLAAGTTLEDIYRTFNVDHPADFKGHSLSVSDVVVLHQNGQNTAHYCDSVGFQQVPEFLRENPLRTAELSTEQNENMIDGVLNNAPSLGELEAKAKAGEQISLTDLAAAVKAEEKAPKAKKSRTAKPKKPSIRVQLDAAKKEQSKQPPPREKTKELEV